MWTASSLAGEVRPHRGLVLVGFHLFVMVGILALVTPVMAASREKVQKQVAKLYPAEAYITAIGSSTAGAEQAEAQARAEVAAQIRSELTSVLSTIQSSTTTNGRESEFQQIVAKTESRTSFKHAELILNDRKFLTRDGREWIAVGILKRDDAARALQQEYDLQALEFRAASQQLFDHERPLPEWTATLRRAEGSFQTLVDPVFGIRALRREPRGFAEDFALFQRVEAERHRRLAGVRLGLAVEGGSDDAGPLASQVGGVLTRLGLGSTPAECPQGGYQLRIVPRIVSEAGMFGPVVRLTLSGSLVRCDGLESVGNIAIANEDFVGTDVRDRQRALASLWQQVSQEKLLRLLGGELARYLPVSRL
jgi:hypothetical protein